MSVLDDMSGKEISEVNDVSNKEVPEVDDMSGKEGSEVDDISGKEIPGVENTSEAEKYEPDRKVRDSTYANVEFNMIYMYIQLITNL